VKWYKLAAKLGNANAQYNLGLMYRKGLGVPQDNMTAVKWYRLAAEQGYAIAQYNLGTMYGLGQGVIQDNVYAHMWLNIAASSGNKSAVTNRDIVAGKMTPARIEDAQKLARECVRKKYKGC
jgi:TPR repeat protein